MEDTFNQFVDMLSRQFGLEGLTLFLILGLTSFVCQAIGKAIPDDATGWKAVVRKICKVLGLYVSNRIHTGVSVADVAKVMTEQKVQIREPDGRFSGVTVREAAELRSPLIVGFLALGLLLLSGCATPAGALGARALCQNAPLIQSYLDQAVQTQRVAYAQKLLDYVETACPFVLMQLDLSQARAAGAVKE